MERLTFKKARTLLHGKMGMDVDDPILKQMVNKAARQLKRNRVFRSCFQKLYITVYDNQVTLPRGYFVAHKAIDEESRREINGAWFEFHRNAFFPETDQTKTASNSTDWLEAGSDWAVFRDISALHTTNATIRATTGGNEDAAAQMLVKGELDGETVFSTVGGSQIEGVWLSLAATTQDTTQEFDRIHQIVKPVTQEPVKLYSVVSAVATQIGEYAPGEENPGYRRYRVGNHLDDGDVATVLAKRDHIDAIADNDLVEPANIDALELMVKSVHWDDREDPTRAEKLAARADIEFEKEMRDYLGTTQTMMPEMDNSFSLGGFRQVM